MKEVFWFSLNSILPIIILIFLGFIIKQLGFGSDSFYKTANSMVFKLFLPVMLFDNVYEIESLSDINWGLIAYFVLAIIVIGVIGLFSAKMITKDRKKIPVITQCAFRSNHAIIGLPLAEAIGGAEAVSFAAVISAAAIPLFNILGVAVLCYYSDEKKGNRIKNTIIQTIKNPLIIGCILGILVLVIRRFIPADNNGELVFSIQKDLPFLMKSISWISKGCSPLALIILGARFEFSAVKALYKEISVSVFLRLIAAPIIGLGGAFLFSKYGLLTVEQSDYPGLIALFASPVAVASAVMVSEIGGDNQLAAQLVVWTSIISMITVFLIVFVMKSLALI